MSLSPFTKITNIMSTALDDIKDEIAQTKVKLAIAEAKIPSDLNEINILRALLTELLKKENRLAESSSSASAGAHIVIFYPFICTTIQFCMFPLC